MRYRSVLKTAGVIILMAAIIVTASLGVGIALLGTTSGEEEPGRREEPGQEADNPKGAVAVPQEEEPLSQYETMAEKDHNRDQNLQLACSKINGIEIRPGETFSFIDSIGECTEAAGFMKAPVIVNETEIADDVGGGICQVSSTLYNAALLADMKIVERNRHSFALQYVPVGLDAMISAPEKDLKIQNTCKNTIRIAADSQEGRVRVRLYGGDSGDQITIKINSLVTEEIAPAGEEVQLTDTLPEGEREVLKEERTGYRTETYREYYKDGQLVNRELISEDTYLAVNRVVLEGSSNITK